MLMIENETPIIKPSYSDDLEKYGLTLIDHYTAYDNVGMLMIRYENSKFLIWKKEVIG
jgi:hypothetical protein